MKTSEELITDMQATFTKIRKLEAEINELLIQGLRINKQMKETLRK